MLILDSAAWTPPSSIISSICPFFWRTHFQSSKCFDGLALRAPEYCYTHHLAFHKAPTVQFWEWSQGNLPTGVPSNVKILRILNHHASLRHIWNVRASLLPWNCVNVCAHVWWCVCTHAPKCVWARMDVCAPIHLYHFSKRSYTIPREGMMPVSQREESKFAALWESKLLRVWPPH